MEAIKRNVLLNPGPATTTDTVKYAQVVPDICPREKEFAGLMKGLRSDLCKVAHAPEPEYTSVLFCGSGTINIDICINSLVPEGKKVLELYGMKEVMLLLGSGRHKEVRGDIFGFLEASLERHASIILEKTGRLSDYVDVEIPCDNLSDRKQLMMDQSDVFIALPGGIGTLDEIFTIAASATIGYHQKPVILYNMKGFWDSLISMLDDLHSKGVTRNNWRTYIKVANSLEEIQEMVLGEKVKR